MNDESLRESLSALADGEIPDAAAARLLDRVAHDPGLREQWRRQHLVSALIRGQGEPLTGADDLAARVRRAVDREPVPLPASRVRRPSSWRPRYGLAAGLAAGVVLAAVVGLDLVERAGDAGRAPPHAGTEPQRQLADAGATTPAVSDPLPPDRAAGTQMTWNDTPPSVEARLNGYLLTHNEYLSEGMRGMLPYARVVGYGGRN